MIVAISTNPHDWHPLSRNAGDGEAWPISRPSPIQENASMNTQLAQSLIPVSFHQSRFPSSQHRHFGRKACHGEARQRGVSEDAASSEVGVRRLGVPGAQVEKPKNGREREQCDRGHQAPVLQYCEQSVDRCHIFHFSFLRSPRPPTAVLQRDHMTGTRYRRARVMGRRGR